MGASQPLAYFITFTTYGTRLHGDERGSVSRNSNQPGTPRLAPNPERQAREARLLLNSPKLLDDRRRASVRTTLESVCLHREWPLWTINVRTNHVHVVVTATEPPEFVMRSMKSWATRQLIVDGLATPGEVAWTRHGSTRYLWTDKDVEMACQYVREGQGVDLPGSVRPLDKGTAL